MSIVRQAIVVASLIYILYKRLRIQNVLISFCSQKTLLISCLHRARLFGFSDFQMRPASLVRYPDMRTGIPCLLQTRHVGQTFPHGHNQL